MQLQSPINLEVHFPSWLLLQDNKAKWRQEEILSDMKKSAYRLENYTSFTVHSWPFLKKCVNPDDFFATDLVKNGILFPVSKTG